MGFVIGKNQYMSVAVAMLMLIVTVDWQEPPSVVAQSGESHMITTPAHPGTITMRDMFKQTEQIVPYESVPKNQQFVYLTKDGIETFNLNEAVERIPIVEVEMLSLDAKGNLVPSETAKTLRIKSFGPDRRPLRSTVMRKE